MMERLRRRAPSSDRSGPAGKPGLRPLRVAGAIVLPLALLVLALTGASAPGATSATAQPPTAQPLVVGSLTTGDVTNPLGIDSSQPDLGWVITSAARGVSQARYEIRVAESESNLVSGQSLLWDSGAVKSGQSFDVPYAGPALTSRTR
jgi:alpha-L-rhamnosidase